MPNLNNGIPLRAHNALLYHGQVTPAGDPLLELEQVSISDINLPDTEAILMYNGSALGYYLDGDQRIGTLTLTARFTSLFVTDAILAKFKPAPTNGKKTAFAMCLDFPQFRGATSGIRLASPAFYCPDQVVITPGAQYDTIRLPLAWLDMAVPTNYAPPPPP